MDVKMAGDWTLVGGRGQQQAKGRRLGAKESLGL